MHKIFGRLRNLKGTKHYVVIHTNKNLNIPALNCYIASFDICIYKRDIASENGIKYYGTPCTFVIRRFEFDEMVAGS